MNKFLYILVLVLAFMLTGCGGATGLNFQDGTWSSCTYTDPDGTTFTGPLQLGGAPLVFSKPNGTKVECIPIPAAPAPAPKTSQQQTFHLVETVTLQLE